MIASLRAQEPGAGSSTIGCAVPCGSQRALTGEPTRRCTHQVVAAPLLLPMSRELRSVGRGYARTHLGAALLTSYPLLAAGGSPARRPVTVTYTARWSRL